MNNIYIAQCDISLPDHRVFIHMLVLTRFTLCWRGINTLVKKILLKRQLNNVGDLRQFPTGSIVPFRRGLYVSPIVTYLYVGVPLKGKDGFEGPIIEVTKVDVHGRRTSYLRGHFSP